MLWLGLVFSLVSFWPSSSLRCYLLTTWAAARALHTASVAFAQFGECSTSLPRARPDPVERALL